MLGSFSNMTIAQYLIAVPSTTREGYSSLVCIVGKENMEFVKRLERKRKKGFFPRPTNLFCF